MSLKKKAVGSLVALYCILAGPASVLAAPPVRIAVIPGSGSGMEQDVVDGIAGSLQTNNNVRLSTVNPDWFVVCVIQDKTDQAAGGVRVNGNVTIKSADGQVIDTVSTQTNKQDFSLQPGAPVNKMIFDKAVRECIQGLVSRAVMPIEAAVTVEMQTRDSIIQAERLADGDRYEEGIAVLQQVNPDSTHFKAVRVLMGKFAREQEALDAVNEAQALAKQAKYTKALEILKNVDKSTKRYAQAQSLRNRYLAALRPKTLAKTNHGQPKKNGSTAEGQLKALEAQKKALAAQQKAIEAQESALRNKAR